VRLHLGALAIDPGADAAYRALAREALTLARAAGTAPAALREVEALLADALLAP